MGIPVFNEGFLPALGQNDLNSILQNDKMVLEGNNICYASTSGVEALPVAPFEKETSLATGK